MWLDFDVRDNSGWTFSRGGSVIMGLLWEKVHLLLSLIWVILVKNILMDLFQLLSSPDVNWWTGVVWIIVMFLSAVWTLILTAPIHCRASIDETLMQWCISTNLMKKQTHLHLGWPESEHIFSEAMKSKGSHTFAMHLCGVCVSCVWQNEHVCDPGRGAGVTGSSSGGGRGLGSPPRCCRSLDRHLK